MANRGGQGDEGTFAPIHNNGHAVFINNIKAKGKDGKFEFSFREGANEDTSNLQNVFITNLRMKWLNSDCFDSLTTEQWDHRKSKNAPNVNEDSCRCIRCLIQHTDHSLSKCFVLAISSHGREVTETEIIFSDGNSILLTEILEALNDTNCPSLAGKPRIIILNTCRGNFIAREQVDRVQDRGLELKDQTTLKDSPTVTSQAGTPSTENPTIGKFTVEPVEDLTLQHAAIGKMPKHYLLIYPVVSGQRALSNTKDGSWLIQGMKKIVNEKYIPSDQPINFLQLLTQVSGYVAREKESLKFKKRKENQSLTENQGNQSATGNQCDQSATGNQFDQSNTGNQGNQSATGYQGNSHSATGNQCDQSATGNQGNQSATGNQSNQSATGNQSDQSATGNQVNQSATGNQCDQSATGNQGNQSATGNQPDQSATGNQGNSQSATGNQCDQSATGNQGNQSATGNQSDQSATGNQGNQSATGNQCDQSATGIQGNQSATLNHGNNQSASGNQCDQSATGNQSNSQSATGNQCDQSATGNQCNQSATGNQGNQSECGHQVTQDSQKLGKISSEDDWVKGDWVKDEEKSGFKNAVCFHHRLIAPIIFYPERKEVELPEAPPFTSVTK